MRRLFVFCLLMVTLLGLQFLLNCSNPLESTREFDPNPDIKYSVETILVIDTLMIIDSTANFDTTFIYDTTYIYDTTFYDDSVAIETLLIIDTIISIDTFIVDSTLDTVILTDTVVVDSSKIDTVIKTDTIDITDTLIIIDTVVFESPDSSGSQYVCNQLSASQKEIVWMFSNDEGFYILEFMANSEDSTPDRILTLEINGQEYIWDLRDSMEFNLDTNLDSNTIIRIIINKPSAFGHEIDLCLTMTPN